MWTNKVIEKLNILSQRKTFANDVYSDILCPIKCKNEWSCNVPFNHLSLVDSVVCCVLCYDGFVIKSNDE